MNSRLHLASDFYVPQQIIDKINEATASMTENGLFQFVDSLGKFHINLWNKADIDGYLPKYDFKPITLNDFRHPLIIICTLLISNSVISTIEIAWFYISRTFNGYYQILNRILWEILMK